MVLDLLRELNMRGGLTVIMVTRCSVRGDVWKPDDRAARWADRQRVSTPEGGARIIPPRG
jgi:hypothetical protein